MFKVEIPVFLGSSFTIFATTRTGGLMVKHPSLDNVEYFDPTIYVGKKHTFALLNNKTQLWVIVEETWTKDECEQKVLTLHPFTLPVGAKLA